VGRHGIPRQISPNPLLQGDLRISPPKPRLNGRARALAPLRKLSRDSLDRDGHLRLAGRLSGSYLERHGRAGGCILRHPDVQLQHTGIDQTGPIWGVSRCDGTICTTVLKQGMLTSRGHDENCRVMILSARAKGQRAPPQQRTWHKPKKVSTMPK
jgi:hypothetical protein